MMERVNGGVIDYQHIPMSVTSVILLCVSTYMPTLLQKCFSYKPSSYQPSTSPMLIVLHGAQRDAKHYRDYSRGLADRTGALVVAPRFDSEHYSLWRYRTGGEFLKVEGRQYDDDDDYDDDDYHPRRSSGHWNNDEEQQQQLRLAPMDQWLAIILYRCIAQVRSLESSPSMPYHFFGHSAGAQLLHRLLLFHPDPSAASVVVANAGSYTFPEPSWEFPYGLKGLPPEMMTAMSNTRGADGSGGGQHTSSSVMLPLLKAFVEAPIILASGTEDKLSEGHHLDTHELAELQGTNRRARAKAVLAAYRSLAEEQGWKFGWTLIDVHGVGHDPEGMLTSVRVVNALQLQHSVEVDYSHGPPPAAAAAAAAGRQQQERRRAGSRASFGRGG